MNNFKIEDMKKITFESLNENAPLFCFLRGDGGKRPIWWENLIKDSRFYIEIRKNNTINVYYQGGSLARIEYATRLKEVRFFTNTKYFGKSPKANPKATETMWYPKDIEEVLSLILDNIEKLYSQKHNDGQNASSENWSEKYIQSELVFNNPESHLDSEFAYNETNTRNRVDLIDNVDGEITLIELKRINDSRMLKKNNVQPEIIEQMFRYNKFITNHKEDLLTYYQKLYRIKQSLGIPVPHTEPMRINETPFLVIYDLWIKQTKRRDTHTTRMKKILNDNHISYKIVNGFKY